jgi:hypothetical protein
MMNKEQTTTIDQPELLESEGFTEFCKGHENPWPPRSEAYRIYRKGWLAAYDRWRDALEESARATGSTFAKKGLSVDLNPFDGIGHRAFRRGYADELNKADEPVITVTRIRTRVGPRWLFLVPIILCLLGILLKHLLP